MYATNSVTHAPANINSIVSQLRHTDNYVQLVIRFIFTIFSDTKQTYKQMVIIIRVPIFLLTKTSRTFLRLSRIL